MKSGHRLGVALLAAALLVGAAVALTPSLRHFDAARGVQQLRSIRDHWWAIPAYIVAYAVLSVFFIPAQPLSIAAPLTWGWLKGGIVELVAATLSSILPWFIGRSALRDRVQPFLRRHAAMGNLLEREGFSLLLLIRLVPVVPYTLLNYLAPLANVRLPQYVAATFAGIIPSVFIFAFFVDALAQGVMRPAQVGLRILLAGLLVAIVIVATRLAALRLQRRAEGKSRTS